MKRCLFTCLFALFISAAIGQSSNIIFKKLNRSSGLPVDQVNCIASDSTGFMWIGTSEGLYKYDGFTYKPVEGLTAESRDILSSHISDLYVTNDGLIWASISYGGIAVLKSNGQLVALCNNANTPAFFSDRTHRILQEKSGAIWCSTDAGLFELAMDGNKIKIVKHIDFKKFGHDTNLIGDFLFDKKSNIWVRKDLVFKLGAVAKNL
jgi:ligand-binding sensor domain-containing protein